MTPFASVAILEKLALLKIALCSDPVLSRVATLRTSEVIYPVSAAVVNGLFSLLISIADSRLPGIYSADGYSNTHIIIHPQYINDNPQYVEVLSNIEVA